MIEKGKKIAEWDPYTLPVIAETSGIANYMDLTEGSSLTETLDDATGISSKSVTDWKSVSKNSELKPRLTLRNDKGEIIKIFTDDPAAELDIPHFCNENNNKILKKKQEKDKSKVT